MDDADTGRGGVSTDTARPDHDVGRVRRYGRSRAAEVLAAATMSPAYRADRAEELERSAPSNAYWRSSFALVAAACACLVATAVLGQPWLLTITVGLALLAAALAAFA